MRQLVLVLGASTGSFLDKVTGRAVDFCNITYINDHPVAGQNGTSYKLVTSKVTPQLLSRLGGAVGVPCAMEFEMQPASDGKSFKLEVKDLVPIGKPSDVAFDDVGNLILPVSA